MYYCILLFVILCVLYTFFKRFCKAFRYNYNIDFTYLLITNILFIVSVSFLLTLNKVFILNSKKIDALHNINYSFNCGKMYAIMGPSGSGKSTLLNIIGLLDTPTNGFI